MKRRVEAHEREQLRRTSPLAMEFFGHTREREARV